MRDKHLAAGVRPEQASHTLNLHKTGQSDVTCFRCGGLNHLARDCMQHCSLWILPFNFTKCWNVEDYISVEEKITNLMWQSKQVNAWCAKWVMDSRKKRNMATLTPQFKIKHSLKQGELVSVAYAN